MTEPWSIDVAWWITAVELPALAGLFWLSWRNRRDAEAATAAVRAASEGGLADARDGLAAQRLEVAKNYASIPLLREVETRLTRHLLRIETKLDAIALPAGRRP